MKISFAMGLVVTVVTFTGLTTAAPKASPRFILKGAEAYDTKTKLTWARCCVGQTYEEDGVCRGTAKMFDWREAQGQGTGDWRLPTKEELISLTIRQRNKLPQMDEVAFPFINESKYGYWAFGEHNGWGWHTRIQDGYSYYGRRGKQSVLPVRLVRKQI